MFDLIAQALATWNQLGMLIGGGLMAGIGALLIGNRIYWRLSARRVTGSVIGVRPTGKRMYYPVYRYVSSAGETVEATADSGSSATGRMRTGRPVQLMVFDYAPQKAADPDSYLAEIVGALLFTIGSGLLYFALSAWPVTRVTWLALAAVAIYAAWRLRASVPAGGKRPSLAQWRQQKRGDIDAVPVRPVEEILSSSNGIEQPAAQRIVSPAFRVILVIVGIALLGLGVHLSRTLARLQATGQHARGTVVSLQVESDSDSSTYHPVVRFSTADDSSVEFKDRVGTDPPAYHPGDTVAVLYDPELPQGTAIIDRGWWNWLLPGAVCLLGLMAGAAGLFMGRTGNSPQPVPSAFR